MLYAILYNKDLHREEVVCQWSGDSSVFTGTTLAAKQMDVRENSGGEDISSTVFVMRDVALQTANALKAHREAKTLWSHQKWGTGDNPRSSFITSAQTLAVHFQLAGTTISHHV